MTGDLGPLTTPTASWASRPICCSQVGNLASYCQSDHLRRGPDYSGLNGNSGVTAPTSGYMLNTYFYPVRQPQHRAVAGPAAEWEGYAYDSDGVASPTPSAANRWTAAGVNRGKKVSKEQALSSDPPVLSARVWQDVAPPGEMLSTTFIT